MKTVDQVHFNKWCLPFWALAAACLVPALMGRDVFLLPLIVSALAAGSLTYLRVTDEIDELSVHFGPLPLLGAAMPYDLIESVEVTESVPFAGVPVLIPGIVGVLAARRGPGVKIRLKRRFTIRVTGLLLAPVYVVQTESPQEVAAFIRQRIGELKQGYDYGVEFRAGCGLQMLVFGILMAALIAFGLTELAVMCFVLAFVWVNCGMWIVGGCRIRGFSDCLLIRQLTLLGARIAYSDMESARRCWMSDFSWWDRINAVGFGGPSMREGVLIRLKQPARLTRLSLRKASRVIVATRDPDGLYEFLRGKLPAEPEQQ